ncbi:MAG: hypothetical protein R3E84_04660 [Pseudomonadales bacterium]
MPLNTLLTADDYAYIVADSRARVLVVQASLLERFALALAAADVAAVLAAGGRQGDCAAR